MDSNKWFLKVSSLIIGFFHLNFLGYVTVTNFYLLGGEIELNSFIITVLIMLVQLSVIISLFVGSYQEKFVYLLPWLFFTAPIFYLSTIYLIIHGDRDFLNNLRKLFVIGVLWSSWFVIFRYYKLLKTASKNTPFSTYHYSGPLSLVEINSA